jgi:hypothetical protein
MYKREKKGGIEKNGKSDTKQCTAWTFKTAPELDASAIVRDILRLHEGV